MTGQMPEWIAVDWGTTHLRAWVLGPARAKPAVLSSTDGMGRLAPDEFEHALLRLLEPYLPAGRVVQVVACGMVGARQGWFEAPYASVPCPPPGIRDAVLAPAGDPRLAVRILPGVSQANPPDVMRGEETQIAGLLADTPGFDGVICLPGTHTKWVHLRNGAIDRFRTFMTGEIYDLLSRHSVLRHGMSQDAWDRDAYLEAIDDAMEQPRLVSAELFSLRAATLLHDMPPAVFRARLSGLLVGLELAGVLASEAIAQVTLIGSEALSGPYAEALRSRGVRAERLSGDAMTLAGLKAAWNGLSEKET